MTLGTDVQLFARYVAPVFRGSAVTAEAGRDWAAADRGEFVGAAGAAITAARRSDRAQSPGEDACAPGAGGEKAAKRRRPMKAICKIQRS
ncbi:hypothetical protein GCM10022419_086320 [Nonomuraea rosea]|uniref:Uncharacterized protein n=1 Tax=Nonomuraea rosea TaxID=638574 RepID=A0ABP6YUC5_9ACTN